MKIAGPEVIVRAEKREREREKERKREREKKKERERKGGVEKRKKEECE